MIITTAGIKNKETGLIEDEGWRCYWCSYQYPEGYGS